MNRRALSSPSVRVGPNGRILALSVAWFSDGAVRRSEARRAARCVECARALPSHRTPYCSRTCQWKFHGHYFWDSARSYVMLRDRYRCQICGTRRRARELDVDHIVEITRGGAALEYSNLQTVCRQCHRTKTRAFMAQWHRRPENDSLPRGREPPVGEADPSVPGSGPPAADGHNAS